MVLSYSEATGDTGGSIMAAIISVPIGAEAAKPRPLLPAIPVIPPAGTTGAAPATPARISRKATPAAVLAVGDGRLSHANHFADQRAEHRGRPAELPGQDRPELLCLAVRRAVIQVDPHPPVALGHDRRRVQEQGETQAADVHTVDLA